MKNDKKRQWIVWVYAGVLCLLLAGGLAYCAGFINTAETSTTNPVVMQSANAEDESDVIQSANAEDESDVIDLDEITVPLSDVSDDAE